MGSSLRRTLRPRPRGRHLVKIKDQKEGAEQSATIRKLVLKIGVDFLKDLIGFVGGKKKESSPLSDPQLCAPFPG